MKFEIKTILPFLCSVLVLLALPVSWGQAEPNGRESVAQFDLREADWGQGESYSLAGQWDFLWSSWDESSDEAWQPITVPGSWVPENTQTSILPMGYGTYRVEVLVPSEIHQLFLYLPDMASAYELWVAGEKLAGNGVIARHEIDEQPAYLPKLIPINIDQGSVELLIKTSNFHYQWGGIWYAPKITDGSGVFGLYHQRQNEALIVSTLLLATGVLSALLFAFRRQDLKVWYFSLLCFAMGLRRLLVDERVLYQYELASWEWLQTVENWSIYLMLPFFMGYFYHLFPSVVHRKVIPLSWAVCLPFCLAALSLDVHIYTRLNVPFQLMAICLIPYIFYLYVLAFREKLKGAKMFGASLLVFSLTVINDALSYNYLIDSPNLIHYGALSFVFFQLASLVRRYIENFKTIERMHDELELHNKELIQLDALKDEFLATTSHELRTPLHSIASLARQLKEEAGNKHELDALRLDLISTTTERLQVLVDDILDAASIKHGKLSLHKTSIQLEPFIKATVSSLEPLLKDKPVSLQTQIQSSLPLLWVDERRLQQVLFNLVGNAIKYTQKGNILIAVSCTGDRFRISVQDSGLGIPQQQLDTLFEPFEQYLHSESAPVSSSGLGLSISKQLVEMHRGRLSVDSAEGQGTVVHVDLPVLSEQELAEARSVGHVFAEQDASPAKEIAFSNAAPVNPVKPLPSRFSAELNQSTRDLKSEALVCFVDDEVANRVSLQGVLEGAGYQTQGFAGAEDLLAVIDSMSPDLVLMDWMMPGMNGLEACRRIRESYDQYELPVVMLTARHQVADIVESLSVGANDYLIKPYHEKELLARIDSQLSVRKLYLARIENQALRDEIGSRDALEMELKLANHQLHTALDQSEQCLLAVNEEGVVVFANRAAETLLKQPDSELSGTALEALLESAVALTSLPADEKQRVQLKSQPDSEPFIARLFNEQAHHYSILILEPASEAPQAAPELLATLSRELAFSRSRIEQIEAALTQVDILPESKPEVKTEAPPSMTPETGHTPEALIVKTMRSALMIWERATHMGKVELAEQSGCWSVYLDGSTAKTRTLDKYLSIKSLPSKPRWRAVMNTAKFVLEEAPLSDQDAQELRQLLTQLDTVFA